MLYPTRTFYLYNNLQELDSKTATDSCAAGTTWNGSTCAVQQTAPTVTVSLEVISTSSSYGSLRLSWSSTNATSCSGTENPPGTDTAGWSGTPTAVGTAHGGMLFLVSRTTTFMITCTGPGGTSNDSKTIVVPP